MSSKQQGGTMNQQQGMFPNMNTNNNFQSNGTFAAIPTSSVNYDDDEDDDDLLARMNALKD